MGTTESKRPNSMEKDEEEKKKKVITQPEHSKKKRKKIKIGWGTHAHIRSTARAQSEGK
jgi:hypothetical protein